MTKLSTRQAGLLMFVAIISLKFITYPSLYAKYAGVDGYLALTLNLGLDLICICVILWVSKKNPNKTFDEIVTRFFGIYTTKVLNFILFIFFLAKSIFLIKEAHKYILDELYNYFSWELFIIPLLLVLAFIMSRSLRSLGRSIEIFFIFILIGILLTVFIPAQYIDIFYILPIMDSGLDSIFKASFYCSFSIGDYLVLLMLLGNFQLQKNSHKIIFSYSVFACLVVISFYIIFYSVFGVFATNQVIAIGDLPLFASFSSSVGRLDWITINLWIIALVFQMGVLLSFSLKAFNKCFSLETKTFGIIFILSIVLFAMYYLYLNLSQAIALVTTPQFNTVNIIVQFIYPLSILISTIFERRKNVKFNKKIFSK